MQIEKESTKDKNQLLTPVEFPELVIGIAGPIGVDIEKITNKISEVLSDLRYKSEYIHLTKEMEAFGESDWNVVEGNKYENYSSKMDYANKLREKFKDASTLARIAIQTIRQLRKFKTNDVTSTNPSTAYIIRQLKLPEEVQLLRKVYGKQFILISAYGTKEERQTRLFKEIKKSISTDKQDFDVQHLVEQLIFRDQNEENELGQNLTDTFHMADVFIDGISTLKMEQKIRRFFNAFFGNNEITPTIDEFGIYIAKSASLRSADLSRQVGASIISSKGDIITQSCNEVAKYGGGNYWDGEFPDNRDIKKGIDPNDALKREVIKNVLERLKKAKFLSDSCENLGSLDEILEKLTDKKNKKIGILSDAKIMDLTEFGRVVHAEMNSICDAARNGISVKDMILYCTTFPCHNCSKHIIASGITKVVYMEPYPKSKALELFSDEIEIETDSNPRKVSFVPFMGISPFRYQDIFEKGKRKSNGQANTWYAGVAKPLINIDFPSYPSTTELWAIAPLLGEFTAIKKNDDLGLT